MINFEDVEKAMKETLKATFGGEVTVEIHLPTSGLSKNSMVIVPSDEGEFTSWLDFSEANFGTTQESLALVLLLDGTNKQVAYSKFKTWVRQIHGLAGRINNSYDFPFPAMWEVSKPALIDESQSTLLGVAITFQSITAKLN